MAGEWVRVADRSAADVCRRAGLPPSAPAAAPAAHCAALAAAEAYPEAVKFLAFALPKREALWWACGCVRAAVGDSPALAATEKYVQTPTDANRRDAMTAGEVLGFDHPAGAVAAAAFFSGGSVTPLGSPPVPPADNLTPILAGTAVVLAAAGPEAAARFRDYLTRGGRVADGADRWPEAR